jgi:parallel beta-helix repeat protein
VTVDKSVSIKGAGAETTIVKGMDGNTVFTVTANNVSISGLTIKDADVDWQSGILVSGADNVKISKNIIELNGYGIFVSQSDGTSIVNNVVRYNDAVHAGNWWQSPRVDNGSGIIVWDDGGGADLNTLIKGNDIYYNFKYGIFVGGAVDMNADGTKINGNKLYRNGDYSIGANFLGMGFMNAMGTISVAGNNILPTTSELEYWVDNCPGLKLGGTPSYGGIPVPPVP